MKMNISRQGTLRRSLTHGTLAFPNELCARFGIDDFFATEYPSGRLLTSRPDCPMISSIERAFN